MRKSLRNKKKLAALPGFHIGIEVREDKGDGYRNGIVEKINYADEEVIVKFECGERKAFHYGDVQDMISYFNDYAADFNARNEQHMQRLLNENEAAEEEQEQVVAPLILPPAPVTTPLFATPTVAAEEEQEARNIEGPYRENFDETSVDATPLNDSKVSYDTPNRSHYLHSFDDISPFTRNFDNLFIDEVCECGLPKPCLICNPKWRV